MFGMQDDRVQKGRKLWSCAVGPKKRGMQGKIHSLVLVRLLREKTMEREMKRYIWAF